jgi:glutamyl-tRNA synthetase
MNVKPGNLMFPTRVALSGKSGGPDLGDILALLGREKSIARVRSLAVSLAAEEKS